MARKYIEANSGAASDIKEIPFVSHCKLLYLTRHCTEKCTDAMNKKNTQTIT